MASTVLILTVIVAGIAALVWCFIGFARALKTPRSVGLLARPQKARQNPSEQPGLVLDFPRRRSNEPGGPEETRASDSHEKARPTSSA